MAEATAPTIESLQAELVRLNASLTASAADLKEANGEARDRRIEVRDLRLKLTTAETERETFRAAAASDPDGLKAALSTATGELRGIKHRSAFDLEANALGVTEPKKLADLFSLSGYKPETDTVDPVALKTSITKALEGRDWLKSATTTTTTPTSTKTAAGAATTGAGAHGTSGATTGAGPGPGGDRGQSNASTASTNPGRIPGRL